MSVELALTQTGEVPESLDLSTVQECLDSLHAASFLSDPAPAPGTTGRARPTIVSSAPHPSYNQRVRSEFETAIDSETADHGVRKVGRSFVLLASRAERPCGTSVCGAERNSQDRRTDQYTKMRCCTPQQGLHDGRSGGGIEAFSSSRWTAPRKTQRRTTNCHLLPPYVSRSLLRLRLQKLPRREFTLRQDLRARAFSLQLAQIRKGPERKIYLSAMSTGTFSRSVSFLGSV